ncbi:helix-turn-helix domain-containing protein [Agrobacterium sp. DE0009]|uniref:helix-turn-helix domain-containing protein n=1 Tax=Agrobacterium sp. DE0009 TaxID=2587505 RepID=UPI0016436CC8|nr:helix-turn-helix domain-containing protein [Agrobacterium sp. DE0009]
MNETFNANGHDTAFTGTVPGTAPLLLRLFANRPVEHLRYEQPLLPSGPESNQSVLVLNGALRCVILLADGRRTVTRFSYQGEVLDISPDRIGPCMVEAASPTRISRVGRTAIERYSEENPQLRSQVAQWRSCEITSSLDHMLLLACKTAQERLCSFLIDFVIRNHLSVQNDVCLELPMCRRDIADHLGMTIETVSRTFTKLISSGALKLENCRGRKTIVIKKPALLARLAAYDPE